MNWQMLAILASGRMTTSRSKDLHDLDLQTRLKYECLGSDEETVFAVHAGLVSLLHTVVEIGNSRNEGGTNLFLS